MIVVVVDPTKVFRTNYSGGFFIRRMVRRRDTKKNVSDAPMFFEPRNVKWTKISNLLGVCVCGGGGNPLTTRSAGE